MFRAKMDDESRGLASSSIARAFAISLMFHFALIAGLELGRGLGFWRASLLPSFSQSRALQEVIEESARRQEQRRAAEQQTPEAEMVFMDVDPAQAVPEPPKDAKFYSAQNTRAANPDPKMDLEVPKIEGTQERIPKTTDTLRPDPMALQPAPTPPPEEQKPAEEEQTAKAQERPPDRPPQEARPELKQEGEMEIAKAAPRPQPKSEFVPPPVEQPRPRPRTLAEARAQRGILEGPKMKQEGGVRRHGLSSSMDVKATPFGAYDAAFIAAVQARWFNLLDEREFVGNQSGRVVVEFNLNRDGRITEMRVIHSEVSETLSWVCQRAILDPAPYRPFPPDLRRMLQRDYRPVRFTFYYNQ